MSFFDWLFGKISSKKQFSDESQTSRTGDVLDNSSIADVIGEKADSCSGIPSELSIGVGSEVSVTDDDNLVIDDKVTAGASKEENVVELPVYPYLDDELTKTYRVLVKEYGRRLEGSLKERLSNYIDDTSLDGKAIKKGSILQQWDDLSDEQFGCLVEVILFEREYNRLSLELNNLLAQLGEDVSNFEILEDEISLFNQQQGQLKVRINEFRGLHEKIPLKHPYNGRGEEVSASLEYPELGHNANYVIYLSNICEEVERTVNSGSGIGVNSIKLVASKISTLCSADYDSLRGRGDVHQIQVQSTGGMTGQMLTDYNLAFERFGVSNATKVAYIRISLSRANLELLKTTYKNNNLKYLMLIISFGNFKNTDGSEKGLFEHFSGVATQSVAEIGKIAKMFYNEFTPESFEDAKAMIQKGVDVTRALKDDYKVLLGGDANLTK